MKKRFLILIAIVLVAGAAVAVHAQNRRAFGGHFGGHGMHGFGIAGHLHRLADELELSDAQRDQIKSILREAHEQNANAREQMHGGYMEIAKTLLANPNDTAAAQALLDRQTANERALKSNILAASAKVLNVLTPEQRSELAQHVEERLERRARNRR